MQRSVLDEPGKYKVERTQQPHGTAQACSLAEAADTINM